MALSPLAKIFLDDQFLAVWPLFSILLQTLKAPDLLQPISLQYMQMNGREIEIIYENIHFQYDNILNSLRKN